MSRTPDRIRDLDLAWLAARLDVPAERIAETAAWRSYRGRGDSLALVELAIAVEEELDTSIGGPS